MRSFGAFSIRRSPSAETSTTSLSRASKPTSSRATSLKTIRSARLLASFSRARSRPRSPRSAANPISSCPFVRALAELAQHVGRRLETHQPGLAVLGALLLVRLGRPVVGDRSGHQDDVGVAARERLAGHVLGGRRLDHVHSYGRAHREVRGDERHLRPAPVRLGRERCAHAARGAIAEEANRVQRFAGTARGHEHADTVQLLAPLEQRRNALEDRLGLAHPPHPGLALGRIALLRADELDAPGPQRLDVRLRRRAPPHPWIHRRGRDHRPVEGERGLRQDVVGQSVGELGQRVRRERCHDQQVGLDEVRVELARHLAPRERLEGLRRHERLRLRREDRRHLMPRAHEQARQLTRLVGGNSPANAEKHLGHGHIVPSARLQTAMRRATSP